MLANAGQLMKWAEAIGWLFGFVLATALATLRRAHSTTLPSRTYLRRDGVCVMVSSAGCALDCLWQKTIRSILR